MSTDFDLLYRKLHGARESLCVAQVALGDAVAANHHRKDLQTALDLIDRVGVFHCPQWSRFDVPTLPDAEAKP